MSLVKCLSMLYVIYGQDHQSSRERLAKLRRTLQSKRPEAEFFKLDEAREVTPARLEELSGSQGLFERKCIIQLDRVMEEKEPREAVVAAAEMMGRSDNVFLLLEGALPAAAVKELSWHAQEIKEYPASARELPNRFALADALGRRDRKQLWIQYQKLLPDTRPEELHGLLFWQVKSMILAANTRSAKEAGLKQFPYTKAKKFAQNYTVEELFYLARALLDIHHRARQGEGDLAWLLEEFTLKV